MSNKYDVEIEQAFMNQLTVLNNIVSDLDAFCKWIVPAHTEYNESFEDLFSLVMKDMLDYTVYLNKGFQLLQNNMFPEEDEND